MEREERLIRGFARAVGSEPGAAIRGYVREGRGELPGGARLLAWDANSIHGFVFDTTNATGIRGASDVLKRIDHDLRGGESLGLLREQVLFAGGGCGVAVIAPEDEAGVMERLHRVFAERTRVASCTAAAVELAGATFPGRMRAVNAALERDRALTGPDPEPEVPFFVERCRVCGRRAAAEAVLRGPSQAERPECAPCRDRIEQGKKNVHYQQEPSDFDTIAGADARRMLAVLYLDGNGIGATIRSLKSPLAYAAFSDAIIEVFRDAREKIAGRFRLGDDDGNGTGALQVPIAGGDDLVVILPGSVAIPFARDLLRRIEQLADDHPDLAGPRPIGAAAGVALGHQKFPVRHLLAEAEAHLRVAKRRVYDHRADDPVRSALSFAVVTDGSPRAESVEPDRWRLAADALCFSGRPYSLDEAETLSHRLAIFRDAGIGRSQLFAVRRFADAGPNQLRNHLLYQVGRGRDWRKLVGRLAGDAAGETSVPDADTCFDRLVPEYGGRRVLDVADMVEVLDRWQEPKEAAR